MNPPQSAARYRSPLHQDHNDHAKKPTPMKTFPGTPSVMETTFSVRADNPVFPDLGPQATAGTHVSSTSATSCRKKALWTDPYQPGREAHCCCDGSSRCSLQKGSSGRYNTPRLHHSDSNDPLTCCYQRDDIGKQAFPGAGGLGASSSTSGMCRLIAGRKMGVKSNPSTLAWSADGHLKCFSEKQG